MLSSNFCVSAHEAVKCNLQISIPNADGLYCCSWNPVQKDGWIACGGGSGVLKVGTDWACCRC